MSAIDRAKRCQAMSGSGPTSIRTSRPDDDRPERNSIVDQTRSVLMPSRNSMIGRRARKSMNVSSSNLRSGLVSHSFESASAAASAALAASIQPVSMTSSTGSWSIGSSRSHS